MLSETSGNMAVNSTPNVLNNIKNASPKASAISKFNGPFRATQLWNDVICHLKENVGRKRRRVKMRTYDNCFTGSEAVTTVLEKLTELRDAFTSTISKEKAVKLCQLMMQERIFSAVGPKHRHREYQFEDSSTKFFRFTDTVLSGRDEVKTNDTDGTPLDEEATEASAASNRTDTSIENDDDEEDTASVSSLSRSSTSRHSFIVQEIMDITGSWKRYSSECLRKSFTPARIFKSSRSLPGTREEEEEALIGTGKSLQPAAEEEIWREVALSQLLTLVDIPVLDPILSYDPTVQAATSKDMAYSNLAFRRVESISSLFTEKPDLWLEAATDCLECLPHGFDLLDKSLSEQTELTQKLRMYQSIVDYYRNHKEPLMPSSFADLHVALLNLLMQGRRDVVLRCLQLSLLLLPLPLRLELTSLLQFMKVAAEDPLALTSTDDTNRQVLEKTFTSAILKHKVLNPHQCGQLVLFMMDHAHKMADCPPDVEELVLAKIEELTIGMMPPIQESTFCNRVGTDEYQKQQKECTEAAMIELMNSILDDTKISLKEKKQRLKQFKVSYPTLHEEHFSDIK